MTLSKWLMPYLKNNQIKSNTMKRLTFLIIASLMIGVMYAQKTATFTSQECGISFTYDSEMFYKVTPQARNTIFKIESSEYMTFMVINVQRNVHNL